MYTGFTLLYYDSFEQISRKKSIISKVTDNNFLSIEDSFRKYGKQQNLEYIGIYDIFKVGGTPKNGQFLGRHTWYSEKSMPKAKRLFDKIKLNNKINKGINLIEILYFYKDTPFSFSLSVLTMFDSTEFNKNRIIKYVDSDQFKIKIKNNSLDVENIDKLILLGVIKTSPVKFYLGKKIVIEDEYAPLNKKQVTRLKMSSSKIIKKLSMV